MDITRVWLLILVVIGLVTNISVFSTESDEWKFVYIFTSMICYVVCFLVNVSKNYYLIGA